jgi:hypothetical protein
MFPNTNCMRMWIFKLCTSKYFEGFIIFLIFVASVMLAIENPLNNP